MHWLKKPPALIALSAVACSLIVGFVVSITMHFYQNTQPIWVEQAAYGQWPMVTFLSHIKQQGLLSAIQESLANPFALQNRHLLQIWTLGIFVPSLLGDFNAPLFVVLPMFSIFLGLFGWTVYKRTAHIGYSAASILLFCGLAHLTRHHWGLGSGFADWQSMLLLSTAALCLLNGLMRSGLGWIRAFAVLVTLAVFARSTAAFYAAIICGPILLIYLLKQYNEVHSLKPLGVTLINILIITFPAILIVATQLSNWLLYYSPSHASQLRQPLSISASNIFFTLLRPFMGLPLIIACITLFALHAFWATDRRSLAWIPFKMTHAKGNTVGEPSAGSSRFNGTDLKTKLAMIWWGVGFLAFLLFNGYTSDVPKEVMYMTPPLLLAAVALFPLDGRGKSKTLNLLVLSMVVFSVVNFGWNAYESIRFARKVDKESMARRQVQRELAQVISAQPEGITWQSYTSVDWGIPVALFTHYEFERFRSYGGADFYNNKNYWDTWYPGLSLDQLQHQLYARTTDCVDAVVILQEPQKQPDGMEDYSYSLAAFVAAHVLSDPRWQPLHEMDGFPFGTRYGIYLNTEATHSSTCLGD